MALTNIKMIAQKMQGDDGDKIVITVWGNVSDWLNVQIQDDTELGAQLMDVVVDALETP